MKFLKIDDLKRYDFIYKVGMKKVFDSDDASVEISKITITHVEFDKNIISYVYGHKLDYDEMGFMVNARDMVGIVRTEIDALKAGLELIDRERVKYHWTNEEDLKVKLAKLENLELLNNRI